MPRILSRLRHAAVLMLGLQMLQIVVLALSPVCEVMRVEAGAQMAMVTEEAAAGAGIDMGAHRHHVTAPAELQQKEAKHAISPHAISQPAASHSPDASHPPEGSHGDHGGCPMAMLCAVSAVAAQAPTMRIVDAELAALVPAYAPTTPHSAGRAPETPPPRA